MRTLDVFQFDRSHDKLLFIYIYQIVDLLTWNTVVGLALKYGKYTPGGVQIVLLSLYLDLSHDFLGWKLFLCFGNIDYDYSFHNVTSNVDYCKETYKGYTLFIN